MKFFSLLMRGRCGISIVLVSTSSYETFQDMALVLSLSEQIPRGIQMEKRMFSRQKAGLAELFTTGTQFDVLRTKINGTRWFSVECGSCNGEIFTTMI